MYIYIMCVYINIYIYLYIFIHICIYICLYIGMTHVGDRCLERRVGLFVCVFAHTNVNIYTCIRMYVYVHIYKYTHIYILPPPALSVLSTNVVPPYLKGR